MMGICRAYGCEQTCGKNLEICDNGAEAYFTSRKCDGFKDCSDGSDEWGCELQGRSALYDKCFCQIK